MSVQLERSPGLGRNELLLATVRHVWLPHLVGLTLLVLFILGLFHQTLWSIVDKWANAETYAHGFFIVPISAWLIWRRREALLKIVPRPDAWAVPIMVALGFVWILGELATVELVQQYAVVAMLITSVWLVAGPRLVRACGFPLFFLLLAVPFGYFLVPSLMQFTADWAITLVRLSGVPVYREGLTFTLPTGTWSVIEACSGLRYLIASFTLGCLYAYLIYRSWGRRALFVLASIVVPIIANGLRAYLIVMIGHLSSMRLATGIDHIIYGWVFFGMVMLILFWIGGFWREDTADTKEYPDRVGGFREYPLDSATLGGKWSAMVRMAMLIGLVAILLAAVPFYVTHVKSSQARATGAGLALPAELRGWRTQAKPFVEWAPHYTGLTEARAQSYVSSAGPIGLYVGLYRDQEEGAELIAWENEIVFNKHTSRGKWYRVAEWQRSIRLTNGQALTVPVTRITNDERYLDVWHWYWVAGQFTASKLVAKALTLGARLMARFDAAALVTVYVPVDQSEPDPQQKVLAFIQEALPAIEQNLTAAVGG
ncbi:exosortase A [Nitrococcus mobilis]|uniref:Methanolan biosynthesis EpsI domain-containing protein n=1 Tax=Nitrococcus mobilis Nb-231 TaxID=314278 RepID=A4BSJ9_9GAMM|nr:exosortase A [Nitrococcus mobilis]EAR21269.1 hypothetical protein NB231_08430 [Nitrococcus mobilis Nb-231]